MLNLHVASLLPPALLFRASTDLGYCIFIVANEKFISIFVSAFRKSDASVTMLLNSAALLIGQPLYIHILFIYKT